MFLEECEYIVKEKKSRYINDDLEISSDDSDEESPDESNNLLMILIKKLLTFK